jgi:hypothetical protein
MIRKTTRRCAPMVAAAQPAIVKAGRRRGTKIRQTAARQWLHAMAVSLLVMATASLGFSAPAQADTAATAAQVDMLQARGQTAYAQYVQYTDNYCEALSVEVFGGADLLRNNQTRSGQRASISVFIVNFNTCTGAISSMYGGSTDVRFKFAPDLSPVDAAGTVIVSDGVDSKTINVALHWEGGTLTSTKTKTVNTSPSSTTIFKGVDNFRSDTIVSGSIVVNGVELLSPANVVDYSGTIGFAYNSKFSTIQIERNL